VERFRCAACGTVFTDALRRIPLPAPPDPALLGHHYPNPALLEPGYYAVDPREYGRARLAGMYVLHPGDVRGMSIDPGRCSIGCWSVIGWYGPNEACDGCAALVGHGTDDCGAPRELRLDPELVVIEACDGPRRPDTDPFPWDQDWTAPDAAPGAAGALARTRWRSAALAVELLRDDPPGRDGSER
jgi:hypothetical protein